MRVIAGELGGRTLIAPAGLSTRPTTDKVRQAVFNSLDAAGLLEGAVVVDLFAGSGAMGIEAISRGAESCVFVERDRAALAALNANITKLKIESQVKIVGTDATRWIRSMPSVDLAFIDPPYDFADWASLLDVINAEVVVAESDRTFGPHLLWEARRAKQYGRTWVSTLHRVA